MAYYITKDNSEGWLMTKRHKRTRNITVLLTFLIIGSLFIYGFKVNELKAEVETQIEEQKAQVEEKNEELQMLEEQYEQMDTDEFIRRIATQELGMVDEDTIVFQIKN